MAKSKKNLGWIICEMEELEKLDVFTNCGLNCFWNGKKFNGFVEFDFNYFLKWKRKKNCISPIETHGVICMSDLPFWFCVMSHPIMYQANLGLVCDIHLMLELACVLSLMETMQSPLKFVQKRFFSFEVLPRSFIYIVL